MQRGKMCHFISIWFLKITTQSPPGSHSPPPLTPSFFIFNILFFSFMMSLKLLNFSFGPIFGYDLSNGKFTGIKNLKGEVGVWSTRLEREWGKRNMRWRKSRE